MSATREITEPVGVRPFADGDLQSDLTASANGRTLPTNGALAAANAERLVAEAGPTDTDQKQARYGFAGETSEDARKRHEDEMHRLVNAIPECRSTALVRAIEDVIEAKTRTFEASCADERIDTDETHSAWELAREALEEFAALLAKAPIANATDALIRAECFIDAFERNPSTGLPENDDGARLVLIESLKAGLEWLALQEPDADDWNDAVSAYRRSVREIESASRAKDGLERAALVEDGVRDELEKRLGKAFTDRDAARTAILSMEPADVGGLLVQIEVMANRFGIDLGSYTSREALAGDQIITAAQFWDDMDDKDALRRGLAVLAVNAAKLRDRSLPSDWRAILDGFLSVHDGGRDVLRSAYDANLNADDLTAVQLQVPNYEREPVLLFTKPNGHMVHVAPGQVWVWEPVK